MAETTAGDEAGDGRDLAGDGGKDGLGCGLETGNGGEEAFGVGVDVAGEVALGEKAAEKLAV